MSFKFKSEDFDFQMRMSETLGALSKQASDKANALLQADSQLKEAQAIFEKYSRLGLESLSRDWLAKRKETAGE